MPHRLKRVIPSTTFVISSEAEKSETFVCGDLAVHEHPGPPSTSCRTPIRYPWWGREGRGYGYGPARRKCVPHAVTPPWIPAVAGKTASNRSLTDYEMASRRLLRPSPAGAHEEGVSIVPSPVSRERVRVRALGEIVSPLIDTTISVARRRALTSILSLRRGGKAARKNFETRPQETPLRG